MSTSGSIDVLVVGAGPTGLTLAAQLGACGASLRVIDRQLDRAHESRALAVQPRTLEVLNGLGLAAAMVERGNTAMRLQMHTGERTTELPLFDVGFDDTAYPFLLFLSQAETEDILNQHLTQRGVEVERGVELIGLDQETDHVTCTLRRLDGHSDRVTARFVVGCDGANSAVRDLAGIRFVGSAYPQTFILADLDADGPDIGAAHVFLSGSGMLFLFPLGRPAPWRLLGMQPKTAERPSSNDSPELAELQALADDYTAGQVKLHDPVWRTYFRLHHRHAAAYRSERVFLAGDAAHVHSPAGAQGMNTGIQDAWNLGWKLALVTQGAAHPSLLDTYETERRPIGRSVLRFTDRAFTIATSTNPVVRLARTHVAPRLARVARRLTAGRARTWRSLGQLAIGYRDSPAVEEGRPKLRRGPRAGDRLPDAHIAVDGAPTTLHQIVGVPRFHLLLIGPADAWPTERRRRLDHYAGIVDVHVLAPQHVPGVLHDTDGDAYRRLGLKRTTAVAQYLVRPDGHIAYRAGGASLDGLYAYLSRWLTTTAVPA